MSLHELLKADVLNFNLTLDLLQSNSSDLVSYCHDNFLAQRLLPDMRRLSGDDCLCFNKTAPRRISTRHRRFPGASERCENRLSACVRVRETHFEHEF